MRTDACFHRRSDTESLMDSRKVVVHVKQRDHGDVIGEFLAERVRQASKPTHIHSHIKILWLRVTRADVYRFRVPDNFYASRPKTLRGAVALLSLRVVAEDLHQLREVHAFAVVVRGPRCADRGRGNRPVDDRRHGPVSATPVRHTNGAATRPTS